MKVENVSFVVIARNEEFGIRKCIEALSKLTFSNCEIIFVDSDSSDRTLTIMKESRGLINSNVLIYQCKGDLNASVARNIGLEKATKEFIFFVDGDTEINPSFISDSINMINENSNIIAVTGELSDQIYSKGFEDKINFIERRFNIFEPKKTTKSGGNIFVNRSALLAGITWNENFETNEDYEFSLQLSKVGELFAIPTLIGVHHTLSFEDKTTLFLTKGFPRYIGYLSRKNIFNLGVIKDLLITNSGIVVGFCYYVLFVISSMVDFFYLNEISLFFLIGVTLIDLFRTLSKNEKLKRWFFIRFLYPPVVFYGFMFMRLNSNKIRDVKNIQIA